MLCAMGVVLGAATPASALDPGKAVTQYVRAAYGTKEGLPQSSALTLAQTADGYLWVGTQDGLARFDGLRFTVFNHRNTDALPASFIRALYVDRGGVLWIAAYGGGIAKYGDGRLERLPPLPGGEREIRAITQTVDGAIWLGTLRGGVYRLDRDQITNFGQAQGLPDETVHALHGARDGSLWVGTADGLAHWRDGRWTVLGAKDGVAAVAAIAEAPDGAIWAVSGPGSVVRVVDGTVVQRVTSADGLPDERLRALHFDRDHNLWIATTSHGVLRWSEGRIAALGTKQGLSNDLVDALLEDREGNLWIGTERGGLNVLKEARFVTWGTDEGLSHGDVLAVLQSPDDAVWIGTHRGGINRLHEGRLTSFGTAQGLSEDAYMGLLHDRAGTLWAAGMRTGLHRMKQDRFEVVPVDQEPALRGSRVVYQDRAGAIWAGIGRRGQLLRLDGGEPTLVPVPNTNAQIIALFEDRSGALWVGTYGDGVRRRDPDGTWTEVTTGNGLSHGIIAGFHEDAEGGIWVATAQGLNRYKNGHWRSITTRQGLHDDVVYQVLEDDDGNFWMCSNHGITRVARREIDAVLDGRATAVTNVSYGSADGMKSVECNSGSPSGFRAHDGRMYFATVAGVVVVDPRSERGQRVPPLVVIEQVLVDGRLAASEISENGGALSRGRIELDPGTRNLEIHYAAPSFVDPNRVKVKYILEGFDRRWTEAGTRRTAYYTNLAPGRYRFRVTACSDADAACNDTGASLELRLRPFLHETMPFRLLFGAIFLAGAVGAWRLRTRRLRGRAEAFERLVDQRTGELQEANRKLGELNARLADQATMDDLTTIANRRLLNRSLEVEWRRLRRTGSPLAIVLIDVDDFKAFNDRYGHVRGDDCLRNVARALKSAPRRATDLVARYGGEEFAILLPETDESGAFIVAERARQAVLALRMSHERSRVNGGIVTISSGVAAVVPTEDSDPKALLAAADEALYRAKKGGRNRIDGAGSSSLALIEQHCSGPT